MDGGEVSEVAALRAWLVSNGGYISPDVAFMRVPSGFNIVARNTIDKDTSVVTCPFSLAVTPQLAKEALIGIFEGAGFLHKWSERQLVCTYICMHWILKGTPTSSGLAHGPYIDVLPDSSQLCTSTTFTETELKAFRGTNLHGATIDRLRTWTTEWEECIRTLRTTPNTFLTSQYSWGNYQRAAIYLTSRAFPSTLLSENPSLISRPDSYPVLLPGVDSLNHARGQPVSWVVSHPPSTSSNTEPSISLAIHTETPAGAEIFNNYGPKPNSELILGYGFSIPNNPDDTIVLKIGGGSQGLRWEVGRDARGVEPVWEAVKAAVKMQSEEGSDEDTQDDDLSEELWATETLTEMAEDLLNRLPTTELSSEEASKMRPEVLAMLEHYVEGQRNILHSVVNFARTKEQEVLNRARDRGIEFE
ncbi:SET domain-containing protein [Cytidiella melzeri]|nr:SET domain-containing protein [Cytidiella melzeri]